MSTPLHTSTPQSQSAAAATAAEGTAAASQAQTSAPQMTEEDFQLQRADPTKIILRDPSEEEKKALDDMKNGLPDGIRELAEKIRNTKVEVLLDYWRGSVRMSPDLDTAVLNFFDTMNRKLKPHLSNEQLETTSLLAWGALFVQTFFRCSTILEYEEYMRALFDKMDQQGKRYGCPALVLGHAYLQGLRLENEDIDGENYQKLSRELPDARRRAPSLLHFVCGDSGSGKTHFALHAASEQGRVRAPRWLGEHEREAVVFFIHAGQLDNIAEHHVVLEKDKQVQDSANDESAATKEALLGRNTAACNVLVQLMERCMRPFVLKNPPKLDDDMEYYVEAYVILDEAIRSPAMLRALTSKHADSASQLLSEHYKDRFRNVFLFASSTVSQQYALLCGSSLTSVVAYDMKPSPDLLRTALEKQDLAKLWQYWSNNDFFFIVVHNRRCAAAILDLIQRAGNFFTKLNGVLKRIYESDNGNQLGLLIEKEWVTVSESGIPEIINILSKKYGASSSSSILKNADPIVSSHHFDTLLAKVSARICAEAVIAYKQQNSLKEMSTEACKDMVSIGVFMCVTGRHPCSSDISELHRSASCRYTPTDPIDAGVVAALTAIGINNKADVTYRIALPQLAMAMLNYGEEGHAVSGADDKSKQNIKALTHERALSFDGESVENFFSHLFVFLCRCIFDARGRGDTLSLSEVLSQLLWPEEASPPCQTEQDFWRAIDEQMLSKEEVKHWKREVPYPPILSEEPSSGDDGTKKRTEEELDSFCEGVEEREKTIHVIQNGDSAKYADAVIVCGTILLLVSVKRTSNYGENTTEMQKDIATLGFPILSESNEENDDVETASHSVSQHEEATKKLTKKLGCTQVVPVFALLREPHKSVRNNLSVVNTCLEGQNKILMKPIVLYVRPYLEHSAIFTTCTAAD